MKHGGCPKVPSHLTDEQFSDELSKNYPQVYNCCLRYAKRHHNTQDLAQDLAQQTMMNAYKGRHTFNGKSALMTWLFQIAKFAYFDYLRANRRRPWYSSVSIETIANLPTDKNSTPALFLKIELRAQILRLSPNSQKITELYRQGWQYTDIAERLNMPVGTVKSTVHRAKIAMSQSLT